MIKVIVCILMLVTSVVNAAEYNIWLETGTVKVRQSVTPVVRDNLTIKAAKNEFEPFQLVIKNITSTTKSNVDVSISNFTGSNGTITSDNVTIFKELYLNITNLTTIDGQTGEWPDALLPKVDAYYHETRNTFPLSIAAGRVQPIWFDVFIPSTTAAGSYSATVTVTENGVTVATSVVNLTVWNFILPATSSMPSAFDNNLNVYAGYTGADWEYPNVMKEQQRLFLRAGLRHRITGSPYKMSPGAYNSTSKSYPSFDTSYYNYSITGYVDGTSNDVEYGASRMTSQIVNLGSVYNDNVSGTANRATYCTGGIAVLPQTYKDQLTALVQAYVTNTTVAQRSAMYFLVLDEAGGGQVGCGALNPALDYTAVKWGSDLVHSFGLKTIATNERKTELLNTASVPPSNDYTDLWDVGMTLISRKMWDGSTLDTSANYASDIAAGKKLWWYHGCIEGGCGITGDSLYNGNSNYYVEYPAIRHRITNWLAYKFNVSGELLWDTGVSFKEGNGGTGDPYNSLWSTTFGANGDGSLYYPGVVNTTTAGLPALNGRGANTPSIGGTHNIPIESIRLKMIRESYEDYEYLNMLRLAGQDTYARGIISSVATNAFTYTQDESQLYTARELLATKILGLFSSTTSLGKYNFK